MGSYPITASGAASPNYTISYANGTLTVNPAPLTITAANASKLYGAALPRSASGQLQRIQLGHRPAATAGLDHHGDGSQSRGQVPDHDHPHRRG